MSIGELLAVGVSGLTLITVIGKWFYDKGRNESIQDSIGKKNEEQDGKLQRLFDWKDHHEEDASQQRRSFEVQLAELRGKVEGLRESHDGQFTAVIERLTRLEDKIDRLEQRHNI